ncbi:hypothetical protein K474DRAFT_1706721 [Panus rudis PR-1116 ss-1]|nr:hypothetical protein K474DRAFT_1706721 [Panus rudis PR-1116 ss-1]
MPTSTQLTVPTEPLTRPPTFILPPPDKSQKFTLDAANKSYKHQYANIYFVRLRVLRGYIEREAQMRWKEVAGDPTLVPRVLDVEKGQLCFIIGTVYMDMPLKPNVLEDIARDHSIPAPPPRKKYFSDADNIMLEDESGRICLVGDRIRSAGLVTGVILGALGIETNSGDFEVVDYCFAGMAPQIQSDWDKTENEEKMDVDESSDTDEWVAVVSGLEVGEPSPADAQIELLAEFLTGELGGFPDQFTASKISRVIIAGNSLASLVSEINGVNDVVDRRSQRKYGHDTANFSPHPTQNLGEYLTDIARSVPVHLLPGPSDPTGTILPQQPLPRAMFGGASAYSSFRCETNPTYIHLGSGPSASSSDKAGEASTSGSSEKRRTLLVHSGQPVNDMFKYLATPPHTRLSIASSTLRWRHIAPTAPDTLWCHPYFTSDPFIMTETPHIYIVGNQPAFGTRLMTENDQEGGKKCRIILVPSFRQTGTVVLVNLRTLDVKTVSFALEGLTVNGSSR